MEMAGCNWRVTSGVVKNKEDLFYSASEMCETLEDRERQKVIIGGVSASHFHCRFLTFFLYSIHNEASSVV